MYDQACKYLGIWFLEIFLVAFNSVENILQKFTTLPFNIIYKQTKKIIMKHYIRDGCKRCGFGL